MVRIISESPFYDMDSKENIVNAVGSDSGGEIEIQVKTIAGYGMGHRRSHGTLFCNGNGTGNGYEYQLAKTGSGWGCFRSDENNL